MSEFILCLCSPVKVTALRRAGHPPKESYRLSIRFVISSLILNGDKPDSLILQGRRIKIIELGNKPIHDEINPSKPIGYYMYHLL
jgi:hypothetical protein